MNCPYCHKKTSIEAKLCVHCGKNINKGSSTTRDKPIPCPMCKVPTSILNLAGVELDFCHECSGIWFDKREMQQFQKVISVQRSADKIYALLKEMTSERPRKERKPYLECPICKDLMIQRNYLGISGILLDQCQEHGTWADKQDLVSILDLISNGDMEELKIKAAKKQYYELENRIRNIELNQSNIQADLERTKRNHRAHLVLDVLGIL